MNNFLDTITTKYQKDKAVYELDSVIRDLYSKKPVSEVIGMYCTAHQKEVLVEMLGENAGVEIAKPTLEKLKKEVADLPVATIEVAIEPSDKLVEKAAAKFELLMGRKVIVDFRINKEVLGGAVIEFEGKYTDYSLRRRVEEKDKSKI